MTNINTPDKVSVAMCTYNGARFVRQELETIACQTVLPYELVVQDDNSTDDTANMIIEFASKVNFPVRLVVNHNNIGASANFAACLARCSGDIIVLTDQDDIWISDRIARTIEAHKDPRIMFTFSDAPLIDDHGALLGRSIFDTIPIRAIDRPRLSAGDDLMPIILRYGVLYGTTLSFASEVVADALPFPANWSHDEWLTLVGAAKGSSRRLEPVTQYRQHAEQVVGAGVAGMQAIVIGARHRGASFYANELSRFEAAERAVGRREALAASVGPLLRDKLSFLRARLVMQKRGWRGIGVFLSQIVQGNYRRFAGGPRSAVKDLALMAGRFG